MGIRDRLRASLLQRRASSAPGPVVGGRQPDRWVGGWKSEGSTARDQPVEERKEGRGGLYRSAAAAAVPHPSACARGALMQGAAVATTTVAPCTYTHAAAAAATKQQ